MGQRPIKISVGVPAHNEGANIGRLLDSLLSQELPPDYELYEVIVVASGCTDNTVDVVKAYGEKDPRIRLIVEEERRGQTSAINKIIESARGDLLVFCCADTILSRKVLAELVRALMSGKGVAAAVGRAVPVNPRDNIWGFMAHVLYKWNHEPGFLTVDFESATMLHRRLLIPLAPLPLDVIDPEVLIGFLLRSKGYKVVHAPKAMVYAKAPDNVWEFIEQRRRNKFGFLHLQKKYGVREPRSDIKVLVVTGLKTLLELRRPREVLYLIIMGFLWLLSHLLAMIDFYLRYEEASKKHLRWTPITSSKKLD